MLKKKCQFYREIELSNVLLEELIIKKYEEMNNDKENKQMNIEYKDLISMRSKLFDRKVRQEIFKLSNVIWRI